MSRLSKITATSLLGLALLLPGIGNAQGKRPLSYNPVVTPNGATLPFEMVNGVKVFHLSLDVIKWEMADGFEIQAWGYNGRTPGPTIEVVEGDRVKILVTNNLPEDTAVHWHGVLLPNGMDGVQGLTQPGIPPGDTFVYEFKIKQPAGTLMYHSHGDEMLQIGMGVMGFFIIHPRGAAGKRVDRDFAIFLNEWSIEPGRSTPDTNVMTDFNIFTFNSRVFPGTDPLVVKTGDRVRIRIANVAQDTHPLHVHGHSGTITGTDGGPVPRSAQYPETTVLVAPGQTRDFEFVADAPGDWPFHCHKRHHPMNAMGHDIPITLGVDQTEVEQQIRELVPGYMAMGETGMGEMAKMDMELPHNTLPMMGGDGPFGPIAMGGMFTILKVRDELSEYTNEEAGWYEHPEGTVSYSIHPPEKKAAPSQWVCPMHSEITSDAAGANCSICGMNLQPVEP